MLDERAPQAVLATRHRRAQGRALRRLADDAVRADAARGARRQEQTKTRRGVIAGSPHRRPSPRCAATATRCAIAPARRRAEQHLDHLRRPPDPEAVPPPRAGPQPRLRDRPPAHREGPLPARAARSAARSNTSAAGADRRRSAMLQQLVASQGDGWSHAIDELGRFYEQVASVAAPVVDRAAPLHASSPPADDPPPRLRGDRRRTSSSPAKLGRRTGGDAPGAGRATRPIRRSPPSRSPARTSRRSAPTRRRWRSARSRRSTPACSRPTSQRRPTVRPAPRAARRRRSGAAARRLARVAARADPLGADVRVRVLARSACTATTTSARCSGRRATSTCSTSKASRRGRSRSGARSSRR